MVKSMRTYLRLLSATSLFLGIFVFGAGVQGAGAVTTLTALGWCRGPLARSEVLSPLPAATSITETGSPVLAQDVTTVENFTEHATLLQSTAPTPGMVVSFGAVVTEASSALEFLSSAAATSSLSSAQGDEAWAVSAWASAVSDWSNALSGTRGFCGSVGRSIAYVTQDWVSSCTLPIFILNLRWSNGTTQKVEYKQSIPGPWLVKASSGGSSLPMWVQADWSPGSSGQGVTSSPGTVGGCNEETPGYPYSLSS
jgi:hypothetical protein